MPLDFNRYFKIDLHAHRLVVQPDTTEDIVAMREYVKKQFLVEMPADFYQFWEFCSAMSPSDPLG